MNTTIHTEPAPTLDDVWRLFKENAIQMRETDRRFQETERFMRVMRESLQETAAQMRQTDKKIRELENLFTSQWGRLVESLVEGSLVRLFNAWGLPVQRTATRVKGMYQNQNYEFDILAHNGDAVVIVEVKTTLRPNHVKHFMKKLDQAKIWLPEYANNNIYGAIAFLHADAQAQEMAIKQKLFAIRATGDSAHIVNVPEFQPRMW